MILTESGGFALADIGLDPLSISTAAQPGPGSTFSALTAQNPLAQNIQAVRPSVELNEASPSRDFVSRPRDNPLGELQRTTTPASATPLGESARFEGLRTPVQASDQRQADRDFVNRATSNGQILEQELSLREIQQRFDSILFSLTRGQPVTADLFTTRS